MNVSPHVDPVDRIEVRQVKVSEGRGAVDPGGVHDDVERPEAVLDDVEHSGHSLLIGDIRECRAARGPRPA
jgi:hypothetical protein